MQDQPPKPVMIVPLDGFTDRETLLVLGIGGPQVAGLPTEHQILASAGVRT